MIIAIRQYDGHSLTSAGATSLTTASEDSVEVPLVCLWTNCGQLFWTQEQLVEHIEQHVDQRCEALPRGGAAPRSMAAAVSDEFVCYWNGCSRQRRPFNARYKLLIHMRVHSGEKPHKCPVSFCKHSVNISNIRNDYVVTQEI